MVNQIFKKYVEQWGACDSPLEYTIQILKGFAEAAIPLGAAVGFWKHAF